jgi:hypothetical protein
MSETRKTLKISFSHLHDLCCFRTQETSANLRNRFTSASFYRLLEGRILSKWTAGVLEKGGGGVRELCRRSSPISSGHGE